MKFWMKKVGLLLAAAVLAACSAAGVDTGLNTQGGAVLEQKAALMTIEAESYTAMLGVQKETCSEGGQNVGYIDAGDWMVYPMTIPAAGDYLVEYRVASLGGGVLKADYNAGLNQLGAVTIDATGGWQLWKTVSHVVKLPAGAINYGISTTTGGFNVNWFAVTPVNAPTPTPTPVIKVEAESYTAMLGVQKETCSEGGQNVGYIDTGDWMVYPVTLPVAGNYKVEYRVACMNGGSVSLDYNAGAVQLGSAAINPTGGWQNWTTVSRVVTLPAGAVNLGVGTSTGGFNLNWFSLTPTLATPDPTPSPTPTPNPGQIVSTYGQLQVKNGKLSDKNGNPLQLRGMSTMGLQWFPYTSDTVKNLKNQYGISLIRGAMYVGEGGYIADPAGMAAKQKMIIDAAIANDIYVLVDWHVLTPGDPNAYTSQAIAFFQDIARTYGSKAHIIYEICNEPNGVNWQTVKTFANAVIPAIRAIDPDGVIIVGNPNWSSDLASAWADRLNYNNIMYTFHFYCGVDGSGQRSSISGLMAQGMPVFVTEWGTSGYSGNDGPYLTEAQKWIDWMAANKVSWANWSLCNKAESSAFLKPGVSVSGPWADSDLSTSGLFMKSKFK